MVVPEQFNRLHQQLDETATIAGALEVGAGIEKAIGRIPPCHSDDVRLAIMRIFSHRHSSNGDDALFHVKEAIYHSVQNYLMLTGYGQEEAVRLYQERKDA